MIGMLIKDGIGISELGAVKPKLISIFRSTQFKNFKNYKNSNANSDIKNRLVIPAMKAKLADEQCYLRELRVLSGEI